MAENVFGIPVCYIMDYTLPFLLLLSQFNSKMSFEEYIQKHILHKI